MKYFGLKLHYDSRGGYFMSKSLNWRNYSELANTKLFFGWFVFWLNIKSWVFGCLSLLAKD